MNPAMQTQGATATVAGQPSRGLFARIGMLQQPEKFNPNRLTTVLQYCQGTTEMAAQVDAGREPYLLIDDTFNPGFYAKLAIYDARVDFLEKDTGHCWLDLAKGEVLVPQDTAVYWA